MEREILFRGQIRKRGEKVWLDGTPVHGEWHYGGIFAPETDGDRAIIYDYDNCQKYPVYADTVGQYTGLTDKNGTRIFEGDILSAHLDEMFPENETRLVVEWYQFGFFGVNENGFFDDFDNGFEKHFVVIGNIHDNPELVGGSI